MFSNLASYIFGGTNAEAEGAAAPADAGSPVDPPLIISNTSSSIAPDAVLVDRPAPPPGERRQDASSTESEEDWVLVGGNNGRAPTLGSLNEVSPRPPTGSTGSSATPSDDGMDDEDVDEEHVLPEQGDHNPVVPFPANVLAAEAVAPAVVTRAFAAAEGKKKKRRPQPRQQGQSGTAAGQPSQVPPASSSSSRRVVLTGSCPAHGSGPHHATPAAVPPPLPVAQIRAARLKKSLGAAAPLTAKAVERKNKAVKNDRTVGASQKWSVGRNNLALKSGGHRRHLKQC